MKIGKYSIDSVWLSIILGFYICSFSIPFMWVSVLFNNLYDKKDKLKKKNESKSLDYFALKVLTILKC